MNVDWREWEPIYEAIRADFGFDRAADGRARDRLWRLSEPFEGSTDSLASNSEVVIAGAGPSLTTDESLARAGAADAIVAASTAVDRLAAHGLSVDWMVTDLDKNPETVRELTAAGTPVAVHAHGDNVELVESIVPACASGSILPTTQVAPRGHVVNIGGFTDGDRAAYLADALGASSLSFVGWDLDDPTVDRSKAKKLVWAQRLLYVLERRRNERFGVLDGRRSEIDVQSLPID
ncbi:6-hydroxymethylpterin diphosphokinase MptE-like protein [Halovivax gelatinilyticus]|uniref:6-hydroxymethylpterin diphosphokinase MptE-like protein n=1 Tax=Halovivax gelatinilyticus TaxID=2961597 RepID=UPI0020CA8184|nr:6-hydroxymethylpterin diphosphokinase MptE-like protein [Halovivax gelatinilyticus]